MHFYKQGQVEALRTLGLLKAGQAPASEPVKPPTPPPPPPPPVAGGRGKQVDALRREGVML